ncbi:MAG: flagellar biosynthetic protein FliR [Bacillota bacterium]|jgi:flagellar biosynthetic protein FliR
MWEMISEQYMIFLMIFARMTGMILFNPFLTRRSVSPYIKIGLAFFCAVILTASLDLTQLSFSSNLMFIVACLKELFIGFCCGVIMQLFLSVVLMAGEFIDLQLGVGMGKIYDPQSNVSMPITGSIFNLFFIISFFVVNGHLTLIKIIFYSFDILPLGPEFFNPEAWQYLTLIFSQILALALKLALPIIAIELVTEMGLGLLMRTVPQINVFMVGLQLKLLVGLILLVFVLPGVFGFFDSMLDQMFKEIIGVLEQMSG